MRGLTLEKVNNRLFELEEDIRKLISDLDKSEYMEPIELAGRFEYNL